MTCDLRPFWDAILAAQESVDATPTITRVRTSGLVEEAHVRVSSAGVSVVIAIRGITAKGRGARMMLKVEGVGDTLEDALASFRDRLPTWAAILNS